jgi:ribosomal protein S18 acetylase RimI-like enzyme
VLATNTVTRVKVRIAEERDEQAVVPTLVSAFNADPAARWVYPRARQFFQHFPEFVLAFGGKAFAHETAHVVENCAAALWLPPGIQPDEDELRTLLQRTVSAEIEDDVFAVFEQMGRYHPDEPHWYLPLIGVDVRYQGLGFGSLLLKHALTLCDRERVPAYLESSNPRNISLYQRHGFEVLGVIQVGSSPQIVPMLRKPQA